MLGDVLPEAQPSEQAKRGAGRNWNCPGRLSAFGGVECDLATAPQPAARPCLLRPPCETIATQRRREASLVSGLGQLRSSGMKRRDRFRLPLTIAPGPGILSAIGLSRPDLFRHLTQHALRCAHQSGYHGHECAVGVPPGRHVGHHVPMVVVGGGSGWIPAKAATQNRTRNHWRSARKGRNSIC